MIEEVYVSLETARLLRNKAFNETCRAYWGGFVDKPLYLDECNRGKFFDYCRNSWLKVNVCDDEQDYMAAPTLQMAMKWLREVHNIGVFPCTYTHIANGKTIHSYGTAIINLKTYELMTDNYLSNDTYEDAVETAIKYCLENLI